MELTEEFPGCTAAKGGCSLAAPGSYGYALFRPARNAPNGAVVSPRIGVDSPVADTAFVLIRDRFSCRERRRQQVERGADKMIFTSPLLWLVLLVVAALSIGVVVVWNRLGSRR